MKEKRSRLSAATKSTSTTLKGHLETEPLERAIHQNKIQRGEIAQLKDANQVLQDRVDLLEKIDSVVPTPPKWAARPEGKGIKHVGTPTLLLSDCHWDEVVNPDEVEGVNCYNREIAVIRLKKVLDSTVLVTRRYFAGLNYEGFVLMLGGDMLSGNIHEELQQTNEDTVLGSVDFWADQLSAFILAIAEEVRSRPYSRRRRESWA